MSRRSALLLAFALLLATALPALAKVGMLARLDAPIPPDAEPGSTLIVGWTAFQPGADGAEFPFTGAPVFIALTEPGATEPTALVFGDEDPSGSGHFTASIVVPPGGIAPDGVTVGLRSTVCEGGEVCQHSDLRFELVGVVFDPAVVAAPNAAAPIASTSVASDAAATVPATRAPLPLIAVGVVLSLGAVAFVAVRAMTRRRQPNGGLIPD